MFGLLIKNKTFFEFWTFALLNKDFTILFCYLLPPFSQLYNFIFSCHTKEPFKAFLTVFHWLWILSLWDFCKDQNKTEGALTGKYKQQWLPDQVTAIFIYSSIYNLALSWYNIMSFLLNNYVSFSSIAAYSWPNWKCNPPECARNQGLPSNLPIYAKSLSFSEFMLHFAYPMIDVTHQSS